MSYPPHQKVSVQVTQRIEDFNAPRHDDPRFPRKQIRSFLKCHGYRGVALDVECDRVMAGPPPQLLVTSPAEGILRKYPYGWEHRHLPRLWRRMFHGAKKEMTMVLPFCVDEFHTHNVIFAPPGAGKTFSAGGTLAHCV